MIILGNHTGTERLHEVSAQQGCIENRKNTYVPPSSTTAGVKIVFFLLNDKSQDKATSLRRRSFSYEYEELLDKLPWAADFFRTAFELTDVKSLLPYYKKINSLITNREFETCDNFLQQVQVIDLSDVLLVGLLRLTNTWKSELPAWNGLLMRSRKEIKRRKNDSDVLLKGLI